MSQKSVLALSSILLVLVIFNCSSLASSVSPQSGEASKQTQLDAVTARIRNLTNLSVDPCDDFYQFACGSTNKLWQDGRSLQYKLKRLVEKQHLKLLEDENSKSSQRNIGSKLVKSLYKSCKTRRVRERQNFATIRQLVSKLGGIPALGERSNWTDDTRKSWTDLFVQLSQVGLTSTQTVFKLSTRQHYLNRLQSTIYLDLPTIEQFRYPEGIYKFLVEQYLLPNITHAEASKFSNDIKATLELRAKLESIALNYSSSSSRPSEEFQLTTVGRLQLLVPQVDLISLLSKLLQQPISLNKEIFVYKPKIFAKVLKLVSEEQSARPESLRNFVMLETIHQVTDRHRIELSCVDVVDKELGLALTAEYARHYLSPETRTSAIDMTDYLRRKLKTMIADADWMSQIAKQGALAKADSMKLFVGYPDELLDHTNIAEVYSGLELDEENFLVNILALNKWKSSRESAMLDQPFSDFSWQGFDKATKVDAYYRKEFNSVNIPPTLFQDFVYAIDQPEYVNFGALGSIVGHAIAEAFGPASVKYDCSSNKQSDCWLPDPDTRSHFEQRASCFVQQYNGSQLFEDFAKLNGSLTLDENIADNIGAKLAHRAYQSWLAGYAAGFQEPRLTDPKLAKYNQHQVFWISLAQFQCNNKRHFQIREVQSPERLRVDLPLLNLVDFEDAFKCKLGSRMISSNRCTVI